ncbi:DUF6204 family protein [Blastococcus sp. TF02A-30]|uniref:DUF6204 family protein n=1 Tax=Blastococcus sp. TF02A-30 TaxID=2250580 RepID=UPI000E0833D8|nr:DUF6204 family protein [Blastococcus sp. TF02A-30]RBY92778.1 hypothetical protein DQ241_01600 [Blastococcus sp. TF02A-30]
MSTRTYRVTVRGVFDGLDDDQRAALRARSAEHDLITSGFSEQGALAYDAALRAFSHRVVVRVPAGPDEEAEALTAGELSAIDRLGALGVGYRELRVSAVCADDIRIRR